MLAPQGFLNKYDARTLAAGTALRTRLPDLAAQEQLDEVLQDGKREAERRWLEFIAVPTDSAAAEPQPASQQGQAEVAPTLVDQSQAAPPLSTQPAVAAMGEPRRGHLIQEALTADLHEPGSDRSRHLAGSLQHGVSAVQDGVRDQEMTEKLAAEGRHADLRRLAELRDPEDQERSWLWAIRRGKETTLVSADYSLAVRAMLGASVLIQPMVCSGCGIRVLDVQGRHALCCMGAETTIGHNRVRDVVAMGLAMADPGTIVEPQGLVPSMPHIRPADVLSRAGQEQGLIACDIGIASPEAGGAGVDCVDSMARRKKDWYGDAVLDELHAQGIEYRPLVVSCYGRRSQVLTTLLRTAASRAARTRDGSSAGTLLPRWQRSVACEVWRRTAAMIRRCLPRPAAAAAELDAAELAVSVEEPG